LSYNLWEFKCFKFLNTFYTYLILLFGSGFVATCAAIIFRIKSNLINLQIIAWLLVRFLADILSYILKFNFNLNVYPVFNISVTIEFLLIISYYLITSRNQNKIRVLFYLIPIALLFFDLIVFNAFFTANGISYVFYNLISTILMLTLLFKQEEMLSFDRLIAKSMFVFHSISFIYSIIEYKIRINDQIMQIVYPLFFLNVIGLNIYISFMIWSQRKK
jgi:hypothetical protein